MDEGEIPIHVRLFLHIKKYKFLLYFAYISPE